MKKELDKFKDETRLEYSELLPSVEYYEREEFGWSEETHKELIDLHNYLVYSLT